MVKVYNNWLRGTANADHKKGFNEDDNDYDDDDYEDDIMRTIMGMMRMRMALTRLVQQFSSSKCNFLFVRSGKNANL